MKRYIIPASVVAHVTVHAANLNEAIRVAKAFLTDAAPEHDFALGYNDTLAMQSSTSIVEAVSEPEIAVNSDAVTITPAFVIVPQRDAFGDRTDSGTNFIACDDNIATQWAVFRQGGGDTHLDPLVEDYPSRTAAEACIAALEAGEPVPDPEWDASAPEGGLAGAYIITHAADLSEGIARAEAITDNSGFILMDDGRCFDFTMTERAPPAPPRQMVAADILEVVTPMEIAPDLAAIVERLVKADCIPDAAAFAAAMRDAGDLLARLGINTNPEA